MMRKVTIIICLFFISYIATACMLRVDSDTGFYPTYIFTHSEAVIFGYRDQTTLAVTQIDDEMVWEGVLNAGENHVLRLTPGVYRVVGNQPYATLVGDAVDGSVLGYFAIDEQGRGTSTLLHTYQSRSVENDMDMIEAAFVIFAYEDQTTVTLTNSDTKQIIWQGTLNDGQAHFEYGVDDTFLTVEANKPVSALSYTDQGYYVPAKNGRFTGRLFYTWVGNAGGWPHDLNLIAYHDNSNILVQDSQDDTILWQGALNKGEMHAISQVNDRLLTISASEDIAVSIAPSISYDSNYYHMLFARDKDGFGIGTNFLYPAIGEARLELFAYEDNTSVEIQDGTGSIVYQGALNQGESVDFESQHTLYTITADRPVSALMNWGDEAGADFAAPYYTAPTSALVLAQPTIPDWLPVALVGIPVLLGMIAGGYYIWRSRQQPFRGSTRSGGGGRSSSPTPSGSSSAGLKFPLDKKKKPPRRGANVTHGQDK